MVREPSVEEYPSRYPNIVPDIVGAVVPVPTLTENDVRLRFS